MLLVTVVLSFLLQKIQEAIEATDFTTESRSSRGSAMV